LYSSVPVACATEVVGLATVEKRDKDRLCDRAPTAPLAKPAAKVALGASADEGSSPPCSRGPTGGAWGGGALKGASLQPPTPPPGFSTHTPVGLEALGSRAAPLSAVARSSPYMRRQGMAEASQATVVGRESGGMAARRLGKERARRWWGSGESSAAAALGSSSRWRGV
jgi:hypothetical protein